MYGCNFLAVFGQLYQVLSEFQKCPFFGEGGGVLQIFESWDDSSSPSSRQGGFSDSLTALWCATELQVVQFFGHFEGFWPKIAQKCIKYVLIVCFFSCISQNKPWKWTFEVVFCQNVILGVPQNCPFSGRGEGPPPQRHSQFLRCFWKGCVSNICDIKAKQVLRCVRK